MAEKAEVPCSCTDPELAQFKWVSKIYPTARTVLKTLHTNKGVLTDKECSDCGIEKWKWNQLTAIVIATKPSDVVRQTLDVLRKQSVVKDYYLKELAGLLHRHTKERDWKRKPEVYINSVPPICRRFVQPCIQATVVKTRFGLQIAVFRGNLSLYSPHTQRKPYVLECPRHGKVSACVEHLVVEI